MKLLFTICGRAGSKGIPNKNTRLFLGKPLLYYTLSTIDLYLDRYGNYDDFDIVLNTDSEDMIKLLEGYGRSNIDVIRRDERLSGDSVAKIDVIANCMSVMSVEKKKKYDCVVDLDVTSPLRTVEDIYNLIQKHMESGAEVTTSVTDARRNPYFNQIMRCERGYSRVIEGSLTARQQAPEVFDMNASMYAYNPEFLLSGQGVLDGYCEVVRMYDTGILDLDNENDFELMQVIARHLYETKPEFAEVAENI